MAFHRRRQIGYRPKPLHLMASPADALEEWFPRGFGVNLIRL
jgi:hypothetical protein